VVRGRAQVHARAREVVFREEIAPEDVEKELRRLRQAIRRTRAQLDRISRNLRQALGGDAALIIEAQKQFLGDLGLAGEIAAAVSEHQVRSEWAIHLVERKYHQIFSNLADLSFRERGRDVADICHRLQQNLGKKDPLDVPAPLAEGRILVAEDLPPSIAATLMSQRGIQGLILTQGGDTSHSVILARTLEIPTILNVDGALEEISSGDEVIVDGLSGEVLLHPDRETRAAIHIKEEKYRLHRERLGQVLKLPNQTRDGREFQLLANIELPFESEAVAAHGAHGVGLYRTEFLFTEPGLLLKEEEQALVYKQIAQRVFPDPLVIRTFDIGRDKDYGHFPVQKEENPALGTMALRLFLREPKLLRIQLKAILRASMVMGNIKVLLPMVTEVEEVATVHHMMEEAREALRLEGLEPGQGPALGAMLEIPGTIALIPDLSRWVQFFSVGTNDLSQYLMAVERGNPLLSYLLSPFQPTLLRALRDIRRACARAGREVTVCGEMAGKPLTALVLMGLGFDRLSMNPTSVAEVKRILTSVHAGVLKRLVDRMLAMSSRTQAEECLMEGLLIRYPSVFVDQPIFV